MDNNEISTNLIIESALQSDSKFLANCILYSERGTLNFGIWDYYFNQHKKYLSQNNNQNNNMEIEINDFINDETILNVLEDVIKNDVNAPIHYSKYKIIRDINNIPLVACTVYSYPKCSFSKSSGFNRFIDATKKILNWSNERNEEAWDSLSFMYTAFPEYDWDNYKVIESLYCEPKARGNGLATALLKYIIDEEMDNKKNKKGLIITCSPLNKTAHDLYLRSGFKLVGTGDSNECEQAIGIRGFEVLTIKKSD